MKRSCLWILPLASLCLAIITACSKPEPAPMPEPTPAPSETAVSAPAPVQPAAPTPVAASKPKVTIFRDTWGIPHIYADTEAAGAYGIGYAQAEDRLNSLFLNVRTAIGRLSEVTGPEDVQQDYIMRLVRNEEQCEEWYNGAPDYLKALGDNFVAGVNAYMAEHPEKTPDTALDLKPWHTAAVGRAMILRWPLGEVMGDLSRKDRFTNFASNEWSVAPSRSADGSAILLTDPHLTWEGIALFHEARVHAGNLNVSGFFLVGSPLLGLGHNEHVGFAATTGGPDTSDVYALKLNPENLLQYEYDGQWRSAEIKMITINVKGGEPVKRPAAYTHLGPLVSEPDKEKKLAFVAATPYLDAKDLTEQSYKMCMAKNTQEFYDALAMNNFMEQNMMFADTDGNIQYVRTGRVPIRPENYDPSIPVPGNTSATKWLGIHPIADLVQIKNPPQGYMQNCNISPANMMKDSPMTPDKYKSYIYNVSWDTNNPRSMRAVELLDGDASVTKEEAMTIAMNVYDIRSKPWQEALKAAADAVGADKMKDETFARAVTSILSWNGEFTKDSIAAPLVRFWRTKCQDAIDVAAIADGATLSTEDQGKMLDLLSDTLTEMTQKYGKTEVPYGDIFVIGRSGKYFPADGTDFGGGKDKKNQSETLLDVDFAESKDMPGKYVAKGGSFSIQLMFFHKDGVESYTIAQWGESEDPASPHHVDQAEKLYSQRTFKPTWFRKDELQQHIESEKVLDIP